MTVEKLKEKMNTLQEGVRQVEAQIVQMQNNRMATLGAIQMLGDLIKEEEEEKKEEVEEATT